MIFLNFQKKLIVVILSLGSNLTSKWGTPKETLLKSYKYFNSKDIKIVKKSSFYESEAIPNKKDPKFINSIIVVETSYTPFKLINYILSVEKKFLRVRSEPNSPRTLDIDIIDFKNKIVNIKTSILDLQIPHPRLENRNFVLYPIKEVFNKWKSPLSGKSIDHLIDKLDSKSKKNITII